jgi:hypothetical protein
LDVVSGVLMVFVAEHLAQPVLDALLASHGYYGLLTLYLVGAIVVGVANYVSADEDERAELKDDVEDIFDDPE